jgi:hypothetical protein
MTSRRDLMNSTVHLARRKKIENSPGVAQKTLIASFSWLSKLSLQYCDNN